MLSQIGGVLGAGYCMYRALFHWEALIGKYGSLSLYWWFLAVTIVWSIVGFVADVVIWGIRYVVWLALP